MTVVLDSWAIMRLLDGAEPVASRVEAVMDSGEAVMSWLNLGEVYYVLRRAEGEDAAARTVADIETRVHTVLPDRNLVLDAARIKADYPMSYADAFAAATAVRLSVQLWTGDPELLLVDAPWRPHDPSASV
jgi:ribonuclease VapC